MSLSSQGLGYNKGMTTTLISLADQKEIAKKIFSDRVERLHSHLLVTSIPALVLCATAVFFGLDAQENKLRFISWYSATLVVCAARIVLLKWYQRDPAHPAFHLKLFIAGTALSGLIWGFAGTLLTPPDHFLSKVFIIIIIAGLNAGCSQTLQASRVANFSFTLTSILPLGLWIVLQDSAAYSYLSFAIFAYLVFILALANKSYTQFINSLQLQYENELLLKQLKRANTELQAEIVEHEKAKNQLRYFASHDFLTGLDNRFSFDVQFDKILASAEQQKTDFCVIFIDIDYFKAINDNYGHDMGDRILIEVSKQLQKNLGEQDCVARIGGDEFIVLLSGQALSKKVETFSQAIYKAFATPFMLNTHLIKISLSMGSSFFPTDGDNKKTLMKKADIALYHAKILGRSRYEFYKDELATLE